MEKEAQAENTHVLQKSLSVVLDEIEQKPWTYYYAQGWKVHVGDGYANYVANDQVAKAICDTRNAETVALVKALRRYEAFFDHFDVDFPRASAINRCRSDVAQLLSESPPPGKPESRKDAERSLGEPGAI